jgi:hypothetical protein
MQIFLIFFSRILCIIRSISICDRGRSVFTFKSRWLSRIHVHFLSLFVEDWHIFNIDLIKKIHGNLFDFLPVGLAYFSTFTCRKESQIQTRKRTFILIVLINTDIWYVQCTLGMIKPNAQTGSERTKQMEQILNFQVPGEGLELVILLHTQY